MVPITLERLASGLNQQPAKTYSPDILPLMQSLLRTLADIDFEFQRDLETVTKSSIEEPLKQRAIATLKKRHHERRAPYLRGIRMLEERTKTAFG